MSILTIANVTSIFSMLLLSWVRGAAPEAGTCRTRINRRNFIVNVCLQKSSAQFTQLPYYKFLKMSFFI
jgi:hypothetical protein